MTDDVPSFEIPAYPTRVYTPEGGVEIEGGTVFEVCPAGDAGDIARAVDRVLAADRYTVGDWFDLPNPVYLVRDGVVETVFRIAVRPDVVELYVLPNTRGRALESFYRRLVSESDCTWNVDRRTTEE